ncbi:MAG: hypothetical protein WCF98_08945 [Synechococcus sp. ELA057]|jgi:hypothetical protein
MNHTTKEWRLVRHGDLRRLHQLILLNVALTVLQLVLMLHWQR